VRRGEVSKDLLDLLQRGAEVLGDLSCDDVRVGKVLSVYRNGGPTAHATSDHLTPDVTGSTACSR